MCWNIASKWRSLSGVRYDVMRLSTTSMATEAIMR